MKLKRLFAVTRRVLQQLAHDPRSIAMLLLLPSLLVGLFAWLFDENPKTFQQVGSSLLALFPFVLMFIITSVTTLRERRSGTLERLMTTSLNKTEFIAGYAVAFGLVAVLQAVITATFTVVVCGLEVGGATWQLVLVAVTDALLGTALGLLASAFARTEFQAVQFMPIIVFPQMILGGLFMPRTDMPAVLETVSNWLPLSYAIDAANAVAMGDAVVEIFRPLSVVAGVALAALVLATVTLRRRTA